MYSPSDDPTTASIARAHREWIPMSTPVPPQSPDEHHENQQEPPAEPRYGQYGQQPGYQSSQPSGYSYPGHAWPPQPPAAAAPSRVNLAFWLILSAGIITVLNAFASAMNPLAQLTPEDLAQLDALGMDARSMGSALSGSIVVLALLIGSLYALIAFMIRKGKNWARITGTVFAAISLFGLGTGPIQLLVIGLGVAGIVLCYLKPESYYFTPQRLVY